MAGVGVVGANVVEHRHRRHLRRVLLHGGALRLHQAGTCHLCGQVLHNTAERCTRGWMRRARTDTDYWFGIIRHVSNVYYFYLNFMYKGRYNGRPHAWGILYHNHINRLFMDCINCHNNLLSIYHYVTMSPGARHAGRTAGSHRHHEPEQRLHASRDGREERYRPFPNRAWYGFGKNSQRSGAPAVTGTGFTESIPKTQLTK